jgi:hypothetical protein
LVTTNEMLRRENLELVKANEALRAELTEIGSVLGHLTRAPHGRASRDGATLALPAVTIRRPRKPITDPEQLERRRAALAKARAARAEKLAAAREGASANQ